MPAIQPEPTRGQLLPIEDEQPDFLQQIADLEAERALGPDDLIVTQQAPPPVGRSWAYDFAIGQFVYCENNQAPLAIHGQVSLLGWIDKCLHTERGAHPIHPPNYGLESGWELGGPVSTLPFDLEARIRDALLFNPAITDVDEYDATFDQDDNAWFIEFRVHLADGSALSVENFILRF